MSNGNLAPKIIDNRVQHWENWHRNFSQPLDELVDVWNAQPNRSTLDGYIGTTRGLQDLIGRAVDEGDCIRALGGGWSFSPIAATDGILVNTRPLNFRFAIDDDNTHPEYDGRSEDLIFVQCGMTIAQLNQHLRDKGKSLKTSGASNGQTIVGAMSTGTHGAAIDVGAVQDYVVALHIITGPDSQIWIERESRPVIADRIPNRIGAAVIRDDDIFRAALVSFGSFGIIHGVVLETEDLFFLQMWRKRLPLDAALWKALDELDFSNLELFRPDERPFHFQAVIDPDDLDKGAYVTVMYKDSERLEDCPSPSRDKIVQGDNALELVGRITDIVPDLIDPASDLVQFFYDDVDGICGTLGEIFSDTTTRGKTASTALGIPLGRVREALDIGFEVFEEAKFAGLFAVRYVKASDATLAFTSHKEHTCVLEFDGPQARRTSEFYKNVWKRLEEAGIPYTFHWGKLNNLDAARVRSMYEARAESWLEARRELLRTSELRRVFANDFLRKVGLDS